MTAPTAPSACTVPSTTSACAPGSPPPTATPPTRGTLGARQPLQERADRERERVDEERDEGGVVELGEAEDADLVAEVGRGRVERLDLRPRAASPPRRRRPGRARPRWSRATTPSATQPRRCRGSSSSRSARRGLLRVVEVLGREEQEGEVDRLRGERQAGCDRGLARGGVELRDGREPGRDARHRPHRLRPAIRVTVPGAAPCAAARSGRRQGTKLSRRSRSTHAEHRGATRPARRRNAARADARAPHPAGSPVSARGPGSRRGRGCRAGRSSRATEREKASCACFEAAYGPGRRADHDACDRDDVHDVRRRAALEEREERAEAPDAAQVVHACHLLDPLGRQLEVRAAPDARVVHEEVHRVVPLADPARRSSTARAVADVAARPRRRSPRRPRSAARSPRATTTHRQPSAASRRAIAAPIPLDAARDYRDANRRRVSRLMSTVSAIGSA